MTPENQLRDVAFAILDDEVPVTDAELDISGTELLWIANTAIERHMTIRSWLDAIGCREFAIERARSIVMSAKARIEMSNIKSKRGRK